MNTFIIHSSLKYLKIFHVVKLSKWIYEELLIINYSDSKLEIALETGDLEVVDSLINLIQNKNLLNKYVYSKIYTFNSHFLKLFIKYGLDIRQNDDCLLRNSSEYGHIDIVKILLKKGANIHARNDWSLYYATVNGYYDIGRLLLHCGADIKVLDECDQNFYRKNR
jgi:ankyrin repeat protein